MIWALYHNGYLKIYKATETFDIAAYYEHG